jgi:hypothetical protein
MITSVVVLNQSTIEQHISDSDVNLLPGQSFDLISIFTVDQISQLSALGPLIDAGVFVARIVNDDTLTEVTNSSDFKAALLSDYTTTSVSGVSGFSDSGLATLVDGTVVVISSKVFGSSKILLSTKTVSGIQGLLSVGTIIDSTSFVINSTSDTDASTVSWGVI